MIFCGTPTSDGRSRRLNLSSAGFASAVLGRPQPTTIQSAGLWPYELSAALRTLEIHHAG
jgi:hypothetical protein